MDKIIATKNTPCGRVSKVIPLDDIVALVAEDHYVTVIHRGGEELINDSLRRIASKTDKFIRVSRSALVNRSMITGLQGRIGAMELQAGGKQFAVSRRETAKVRSTINRMVINT